MFAEKVQNFAKIRNFSPCGHTEFGLFCLTSTHISHFKRQLLKTVFDFDPQLALRICVQSPQRTNISLVKLSQRKKINCKYIFIEVGNSFFFLV